jgi:hypothetical protein
MTVRDGQQHLFGGVANPKAALTEFGSLVDGLYRLTILAAHVSGAGQPLDGDANGTAGGTIGTSPMVTAGGLPLPSGTWGLRLAAARGIGARPTGLPFRPPAANPPTPFPHRYLSGPQVRTTQLALRCLRIPPGAYQFDRNSKERGGASQNRPAPSRFRLRLPFTRRWCRRARRRC